jgi:hypothetical protein
MMISRHYWKKNSGTGRTTEKNATFRHENMPTKGHKQMDRPKYYKLTKNGKK